MPVHNGKDKHGHYYRWGSGAPGKAGSRGKKYYYTTDKMKKRAYERAARQGRAIKASIARK